MSDVERDQLPGLQAERTMLSWERTSVAILGSGALLLVRVAEPTSLGPLFGAAGALVLSILTAVIGWLRARRIGRLRGGSTPAPTGAVTVLAFGTVALAASVLVMAVSG